jgi:hypothetical protein
LKNHSKTMVFTAKTTIPHMIPHNTIPHKFHTLI